MDKIRQTSRHRNENAAKRRTNERRGRWAEGLALAWLRLKGYRLLARRFRSPRGEIDLVMARGGLLAFVEVKRRGSERQAREALRRGQRRRIEGAAEDFLRHHAPWRQAKLRFDLVTLRAWGLPRHLPDAWRP